MVGNKLRGTIRLGTTARALELWEDIQAGIVLSLSIGYQWLDFFEAGSVVTVNRWQPFEAALVAAPADPNAGIYRAFHMPDTHNQPAEKTTHSERRARRRDHRRARAQPGDSRLGPYGAGMAPKRGLL